MHCHYFGNSDAPLFGVYHAPRKARGAQTNPELNTNQTKPAILICPPIGHEYLRTHWCLRRVASSLARSGYPVLRFDYQGLGDSSGDTLDILSLESWVSNIRQARQNLIDESGVQRVIVVGLRLGGLLAAEALTRSVADSNNTSLILWDPVTRGSDYLAGLRCMQAEMLDLWYCQLSPNVPDGCQEILGSLYRNELIHDLEALDISERISTAEFPVGVLDGSEVSFSCGTTESELQVAKHQDPADWHLLSQIETAWLPSSGPQLLEAMLPKYTNNSQSNKTAPIPANTISPAFPSTSELSSASGGQFE